jgi:hypothetical protein
VLVDGTNEPGQVCNAISFGIGFDAVAVQMGPHRRCTAFA